jgi:glycine oxidase
MPEGCAQPATFARLDAARAGRYPGRDGTAKEGAMADVVVIGGGAVGLAVARELRGRGRAVTLLERAQPGRAASWASAGIVSSPSGPADDPNSRLAALSYRLWPAFAEALAAECGLDPEFRLPGCLIPAFDDEEAGELERLHRRGRIEGSAFLAGGALREAEPVLGPAVRAALHKPGGNVENRRLCTALELAARGRGVDIRAGSEARAIRLEGSRVVGVELADGLLPAECVVVAAGAWTGGLPGCRPAVPVRPQRGQILALQRGEVALRHVILTPGDPYLVPRADGRIVVGATREEAGWDASPTAGGVGWLLTSAVRIAPALAGCALHEIWTGFRPLSPDGVPIIGPGAADGLFFATGHGPSGIGPLPGTVALLAALLDGEAPPLPPEPFSPLRFAS